MLKLTFFLNKTHFLASDDRRKTQVFFMCFIQVAVDRKVIVMRKAGIIHSSTLNISVVVRLFFYQLFNAYSPFLPK